MASESRANAVVGVLSHQMIDWNAVHALVKTQIEEAVAQDRRQWDWHLSRFAADMRGRGLGELAGWIDGWREDIPIMIDRGLQRPEEAPEDAVAAATPEEWRAIAGVTPFLLGEAPAREAGAP